MVIVVKQNMDNEKSTDYNYSMTFTATRSQFNRDDCGSSLDIIDSTFHHQQKYQLEERCASLKCSSRNLLNHFQDILKLFWRLVMAQYLTTIIYFCLLVCFSF